MVDCELLKMDMLPRFGLIEYITFENKISFRKMR